MIEYEFGWKKKKKRIKTEWNGGFPSFLFLISYNIWINEYNAGSGRGLCEGMKGDDTG